LIGLIVHIKLFTLDLDPITVVLFLSALHFLMTLKIITIISPSVKVAPIAILEFSVNHLRISSIINVSIKMPPAENDWRHEKQG